MPWKGKDYQPSREEAYAALTSSLFGEERDDLLDQLTDLENGVRRYWADQLRRFVTEIAYPDQTSASGALRAVMLEVVDRLDPYSEVESPAHAFARTRVANEIEKTEVLP